jgi:inner membrane protein
MDRNWYFRYERNDKEIVVDWNGKGYSGIPGLACSDIAESGGHILVPGDAAEQGSFSFEIDLNGSRALNFVPLGKTTKVVLSSEWDSPAFTGAFLPDERTVNNSGFTARWDILNLNRNYPQAWTGNKYKPYESVFGVELITPVDNYQKSTRSAKYSVLFVALTFLVFLFAEIMNKVRIHAIHYLLAGLAVVVFYSLLTHFQSI